MKILRYNTSLKNTWDDFVRKSRNGTFLIERDYMDYHAHRFTDYSLLFYTDKNELIALLPGNVSENTLYSHQGLTYGGLIVSQELYLEQMLLIMKSLKEYLLHEGLSGLVYKKIPAIYQAYPADEDLYALFREGAGLTGRAIASVVDMNSPLPMNENRRRGVRKAKRAGIEIRKSIDFTAFWNILTENLNTRYHTDPVHSLEEISRLHALFPAHIHCYEACLEGEVLAGTVIYETERVAHVQYITASDKGKSVGALDLLFHTLLTEIFARKRWFDFGISTENNGVYLNEGLIRQKEGFGARGITYDIYQMTWEK